LDVKKITGIAFPLFTLAMLFRGLFVSDAYAYLDPGSASMFIQVIFGVLVGVGIAIKLYWVKIRFKISEIRANRSKNE
jgi:NhaP-type Na+/H+ or K+/H+ antiporter